MSTYFVLNKRGVNDKPYSKKSEFQIRLYYYFNGSKVGFSTNVKVKEKDWNYNNTDTPIKSSDIEHTTKNSVLRSLKREVDKVVDLIKVGGKEPIPKLVKDKFSNTKQKENKEVNYEYSVNEVFSKYLLDVIEDKGNHLTENYRRSYRSSSKHIKSVLSSKFNNSLYFDQIDGDVIDGFVNYGITNELSNSTIQKYVGHFRTFINWSRERGYHKNVSISYYSKKIIDNSSDKDIVYLYRNELKKLFEFDQINYENPKHTKHTSEYIIDELKNEERRTYTNLEFCRDIFLFQCGVGSRYGDTIKLQIKNFDFTKKEFKIFMEKTNRTVRVPINEITNKIFRKYSKNKTLEDYIFPQTVYGNFYSNQKINHHLKYIGEICKLNRLVNLPIRSGKNIIDNSDKSVHLHSVLTTHCGRRTFIKEGIINKIEPYVIMSLVGHKSLRVFERYFSINDEDRKVSSSLFSFVSDNPSVLGSNNKKGNLKEQLKELKSLLDEKLIDKKTYIETEKELLSKGLNIQN